MRSDGKRGAPLFSSSLFSLRAQRFPSFAHKPNSKNPFETKLQETIEREGRRADLARRNAAASGSPAAAAASAASASASPSNNSNKLKRAEKLQSSMKLELLKEMGVVRVKQVFVGLISMMGLLRVMTHNFEGVPLLRLPFEPFKMLRSVAHRGLKEEDALPAVAGYVRVVCVLFGGTGERERGVGVVELRGERKRAKVEKTEESSDPKLKKKNSKNSKISGSDLHAGPGRAPSDARQADRRGTHEAHERAAGAVPDAGDGELRGRGWGRGRGGEGRERRRRWRRWWRQWREQQEQRAEAQAVILLGWGRRAGGCFFV